LATCYIDGYFLGADGSFKIQTALFALLFVALLPRLRQQLICLKDKIALARLAFIPAM
jgi:hypothetical protein